MPPKLVYYVRVWGRNARPTQDMGMPPQENTMNYATIKYCDIANGEGVRTSLFVSGCRRHCPNCFNAVAWDFGYGAPFTKEVRNEILESLAPGYINGLSLLGGEPFEPENQRELLPFIKNVKVLYPNKTIWCYTGNNLEHEIWQPGPGRCEVTDEFLQYIDVLVDGDFVQAAIEDAGALGVMTAFNRVGITATNAHTGLLKNILRGEWGFKGLESQDFIMNPNYAVLKEYALNGGTMTTFTGENTMAAVSEKFAYWTTENVGQDTELMSAIKQAMTWQAYALANSNALDGMASSTRLVSVRTWYDNALVAVQVVFAALTVLAAAMYVLNDRKSKKQ